MWNPLRRLRFVQLAQIVATVLGDVERAATEGPNGYAKNSGIRRGTDVLKAIALGAKAVLIGRPYAWALAADGEAGVTKLLELLREELVSAMLATGSPNIAGIKRDLVMS